MKQPQIVNYSKIVMSFFPSLSYKPYKHHHTIIGLKKIEIRNSLVIPLRHQDFTDLYIHYFQDNIEKGIPTTDSNKMILSGFSFPDQRTEQPTEV